WSFGGVCGWWVVRSGVTGCSLVWSLVRMERSGVVWGLLGVVFFFVLMCDGFYFLDFGVCVVSLLLYFLYWMNKSGGFD
ncbi:hypothetical protein RA277_30975, partial [Pseudomonas syringae pv. tagetis]